MRGSMITARAIAVRCFCPPDSVMPALADQRVVALRESRRRPCRAARLPPPPALDPCAMPSAALVGASSMPGRRLAAGRLLPCPPLTRCPPPYPPHPRRIEPERDVVGERVGEQERLLRDEADRAAQDARAADLADVHAVDEYRAWRRIVQPRQQADQRRLPRSGRRRRAPRSARPGCAPRRD